jgi:hypothetical protein
MTLPVEQALRDSLLVNKTLRVLQVCYSKTTNEWLPTVVDAVACDPNIRDLFLYNCGSIRDLVAVFPPNSSLECLAIEFHQEPMDGECVTALSNALLLCVTLRRLKKLELRRCRLDGSGAAELAGVLATNTTLESLSLSSNVFGGQGAKALARVLFSNETLKRHSSVSLIPGSQMLEHPPLLTC